MEREIIFWSYFRWIRTCSRIKKELVNDIFDMEILIINFKLMQKIKDIRNIKDCIRIKNVLLEKGYDATLKECEELWQEFSNSMCAWWLYLPDTDDMLLSNIEEVLNS